jgi:putative intracellular protease/amidase
MRLALFLPQRNFRDETVSMVRMIMGKWGVNCDIVSYGARCVGSHGAVYPSAARPTNDLPLSYDGIILADGDGIEEQKIYDYRPLLDIITGFNERKKPIISIGNATKILARANIIKGRRVSVGDVETKRLVTLFYGMPSQNGAEASENLVTIRDSKSVEVSAEQVLQHIGVM